MLIILVYSLLQFLVFRVVFGGEFCAGHSRYRTGMEYFPRYQWSSRICGDGSGRVVGQSRKDCGGQLSFGYFATLVRQHCWYCPTTMQVPVECLFSTKNDTKFRASLGAETLRNLLHDQRLLGVPRIPPNADFNASDKRATGIYNAAAMCWKCCRTAYLFVCLFVWIKKNSVKSCVFLLLYVDVNILYFIVKLLEGLKVDVCFSSTKSSAIFWVVSGRSSECFK